VLALDALYLLRELRGPAGARGRWGEPAFAREVELVRRHLAPLHSRMTLMASFGSEAFQATGPDEATHRRPLSAVRVAYALRWLELGAGQPLPPWLQLLEG
jgi:hypothetical protein